jgi:hypothetical protein
MMDDLDLTVLICLEDEESSEEESKESDIFKSRATEGAYKFSPSSPALQRKKNSGHIFA